MLLVIGEADAENNFFDWFANVQSKSKQIYVFTWAHQQSVFLSTDVMFPYMWVQRSIGNKQSYCTKPQHIFFIKILNRWQNKLFFATFQFFANHFKLVFSPRLKGVTFRFLFNWIPSNQNIFFTSSNNCPDKTKFFIWPCWSTRFNFLESQCFMSFSNLLTEATIPTHNWKSLLNWVNKLHANTTGCSERKDT